MAESSWWDDVLNRMFAMGTSGMIANRDILGMDDTDSRISPSPTPSPSPSGNRPANPNQRENEQVVSGITGAINAVPQAPELNPLYGNVPNGKVFLGVDNEAMARNEKYSRGANVYKRVDKTSSIQDVLNGLNTWSTKKLKKFSDLAVSAGLLQEPTVNYEKLEPILGALAIRSAKLYEQGVKVTPWSLLERYGTGALDAAKAAGPVTTTSTNRSVDLSSGREANSLIEAALAQRLGRSATDAEKKKFLAALNEAEKKEPTTTKTTTTTTGAGTPNVSSDSSTQTSGGVNASSFAEEWSLGHNKDEAGSYQALSQYMPLFFQSLSSPI